MPGPQVVGILAATPPQRVEERVADGHGRPLVGRGKGGALRHVDAENGEKAELQRADVKGRVDDLEAAADGNGEGA